MIPRPLWRANWGYFRRHRWLLLSMWLGVALGTAVVAGVELTTRSADANFRLASERLTGRATHRLTGAGPVSDRWLVPLQQQLGVTAAPVIQRYLRVEDGPLLQLLAVDLLQAPRFRPPGQLPANVSLAPADWLLQPGLLVGAPTLQRLGLSVGDGLAVEFGTDRARLPVIGVMGAADDVRFSRLALIDIGQAQALLGMPGQLDWIELILDHHQEQRVRAWLPAGLQLHPSTAGDSEALAESLYLNLRALSLLALVVGLFLVYNSLQFSLVQRQPLLARLRTLGVSVAELRRYFALELLLVAVAGTLSGILLGTLLAGHLLRLVTLTVNNLYAVSPIETLQLTPAALGQSLLVGTLGAFGAGWWPLRRALRASPIEAQRRGDLDRLCRQQARRQGWLALVCLLPVLLLWWWPGSGLAGGLLAVTLLLLAVALLMPLLVRALAAGLGRALAVSPGGLLVRMALRDAGRGLSRTGVAVMALTLAVTATVGIGVLVGSFRDTLEGWLQQRLNADLYLAPLSKTPGDTRRLPSDLVTWLAQQPAVAALAEYRRRDVRLASGRRVELFGAELPAQARAGYRFRDRGAESVWAAFDQPDQVLLSEPLANHLHLAAGDRLALPTPRGSRHFTVAGVYYDYGYPQGRLLFNAANYRRYWDQWPPRVAGIYLKDPKVTQALIGAVQQRPGAEGWRISETQGVIERSLAVFAQTFRVTELLRLLAVGVAFVGILASLMALQLERQQELRLFHALGLSLAERRRLLLWQALFLGAVAGFVAVPAGVLLGWALAELVQLRAFGWSLAFSFPFGALWQAPLLALSAALLSVLYPAWRLRDTTVGRGAE